MEFGAYELDGEIARGGMGVVYLARDPRLNRPIALKMIRSGALASESEVERFRTEAEAAANLDHPHIVPIYEIGEADGFHYFTMKLLEGGHLGELNACCNKRDVTWQRRAAQILAKIARAVHHAHQHGVLHRDIKPTNILLDENGEPHLTDFGLAKLLTSGSSLTLTTDVLGTPSYMAPEQAAGNARGATTAADIYSLGAVLYELLAGIPPFQGATAVEVLKHAQEKEVPSLRALNPAIAPDLETICLKCLEKDPARRFTTAEALADDLTRFLNDEPILAGRPSRIYRPRKFLRRHRLAAGALCVVSLCLLALVGGAGWVARDQGARQALASSQTELALTELASWLSQDNLPEAKSALKRAEGFSAAIPHDSLAARVRQWRADLALVEKLDAIQAESGRLTENGFDALTTSEAYAEALRPLGVSLDLAAEDRTARAQRLRASPIWRRLGDAMDDWSIWAKDSRAALRWAEEIDRDPERNEVRRAIADGDIATLIRLGKQSGQTPIPVRSALLLARSLKQAGEVDMAAAVLRTCRVRYPDDFWLNRQWGYMLATALQNSAEAVAVTQATVALRPQSVIARLDLAMALLRVKRYAEAEQHLRETLRFAPNDPLVSTNLASTLRMQRRLDEAWTVLQSALDHFPNNADAHFEAASLHQAGNNVEARLAELQEAVRLQPKSSRYRGWLGEFYLEQAKLTEAEAQFRETLQNDPQCLHAFAELRGLFLSQHRHDELATLERDWIANNHPRNRKTPPELIDLSRHYNAALDAGWQDPKNEALHLGALPMGIQNLTGISFDIRGVIQLSGKNLDLLRPGFPNGVRGIAVGRECKRINFLHGTAWSAGNGATIAEYVIHRTDGTQETVPVIYGRHTRDWLSFVGSPTEVSDAKVAWQSPLAALKDRQTSLYATAWENSAPSIPIASIDFVSQRGEAAPFLIAITIEP